MSSLEDSSLLDEFEMGIGDICSAYKDIETL